MFDPVTAAFLRTAPALPGLDPEELPQTLTARFADLVARRLRQSGGRAVEEKEDEEWPLTRIADTYELVTSLTDDEETRRAAAFVAGTAQQILAQEHVVLPEEEGTAVLDRDRVDPALASAVLFLTAEQHADANEAAQTIRIVEGRQLHVATLLAENVRDLAMGRLGSILARAERRPAHFTTGAGLEARSMNALFQALLNGVERFAAEVLNEDIPEKSADQFDTARAAFTTVLSLSNRETDTSDPIVGRLLTTYPGPRHLASLLLSAYDAMASTAVTKTNPPPGTDTEFWQAWLRRRAASTPFTWRNHREAIAKKFHHNGVSAVMVLPTGAGKTTVSCLKIASVLGSGKSVIFVAPTHALVEQLTDDLQEIFPEDLLGSIVSSDFDRLFAEGTQLRKIEIMTPEHCLALLSYAPEEFGNVGLMVFDECHLLSPVSGLRRAIDGMFCVLAFNSISPQADFLFLSAMIKNGAEFASWIGSLTGRECAFIDPLWKPSRQARGIVFYEETALKRIRNAALKAQHKLDRTKRKQAKHLRKAANDQLRAEPYAMFGLHHNWLHEDTGDCSITKLSDTPVQLTGTLRHRDVFLKPNVNTVAAHIAEAAARNGLKTIVFVNVKSHAVSAARQIADSIDTYIEATADELQRWEALEIELGSLDHSLLGDPSIAVPHNANMIRLERDLAERMFRRPDGARVIVATPTLAQGLNLPAHLAILASDMRADQTKGGREPLGAHEILNAAARAGRAGHLANGVVLMIPEQVLAFSDDGMVNPETFKKLQAVLPKDDRCIEMGDPMQLVLDRIDAASLNDPDVEYTLNRLATAVAPEGADTAASTRFAVRKSFAAFLAAQRGSLEQFNEQIERLNALLAQRNTDAEDQVLLELAAQSGTPVSVLNTLRERLTQDPNNLPETILGWASWIFEWLSQDEESRLALLERERTTVLGAVGRKTTETLSSDAINELLPGVLGWLSGKPIRDIEIALGGDPTNSVQSSCPRARKLVTGLVPLGLTFISGLVSRTTEEIPQRAESAAPPRAVVECLPTAMRRGFDSPLKIAFAEIRTGFLSRVQAHQAYTQTIAEEPDVSAAADYGAVVNQLRAHLG